jgi:hypothetical protein
MEYRLKGGLKFSVLKKFSKIQLFKINAFEKYRN